MYKTATRTLIILLLIAGGSFAQQQTAELTGTISDPSGAAVPGATVTIANTTRGVKRVVTADVRGNYVVLLLPPAADYQITVSKSGFKQFVQKGITLQVAQVATIDVKLQMGSLAQSVNVTAAPPLLDRQTSSIGQVINERTVDEIPLNGRSSFRLVQLTPGVNFSPSAYGQFGDVPVNTTWDTNFSINGGRSQSNEILIDGVPSTVGYFDQITTIPSVNDTQEFKVQGDNLSAEYGRFAGGVVNVVTKAGTSELHGDVYEFLRNDVLDANDFFDNRAGRKIPPLRMNQFGFAMGGPVVVPKVYDGKDKTFFFADYQGTRRNQGATFVGTVPTLAQRSGDFSQTLNSAGELVTIYDPFSTRPNPASPGQYIRDAFLGNVIPSGLIDSVASKLMSYYPAPNTAGAPFTHAQNFVSNASLIVDQDEGSARIDHNVTSWYRLFGRFAMSDTALHQPNYFENVATPNPGAVGITYFDNHTFTLDNTLTLNPTLLLTADYGFARWYQIRQTLSYGFDNATLGFPSSLASQIQIPMFPAIVVPGYTGMANQSYLNNGNDSHSFLVSLTKIAGRQTLTLGTDIRMHRINFLNVSNGGGIYRFAIAQTQGPDPNVFSTTAGNALASLLLGSGNSGSMPIGSGVEMQDWYYAGYVQNDIQVTKRLTLNFGLRYETESPYVDRHNKLAYFDSALPSPAKNTQFPNLTGGLVYAGVNGSPRNVYRWKKDNFGPRFGFAYSLTGRTVVRGGFGVVYAPLEISDNAVGFAPSPGFSSSTSWVTSLNGGLNPFNLLRNPFPTGLVEPAGNSLGAATFLGQGIAVWDSNPKTPQTLQWNLDIQRQLPGDTLVDAVYVGTRGLYLTSTLNMDALNPEYLTQGTALQQLVPNPFASVITSGPLAQPKVARSQLLLPYPQFTGVSAINSTWGSSIYHAMQLKVNKRTTHGISFLASYTIGKLISNVPAQEAPIGQQNSVSGVQNWYDLKAEKSLSEIDVPQALVLSAVVDLPLGPGRRFWSGAHGPVSKLVGGWQATGILTERSGFPLALSVPIAGGGDRPNRAGFTAALPSSRSTGQKVLEWFNTKAFTVPSAFTLGNVSRTEPNVRGPGLNNLDLSLIKNTRLSERFNLQFRAESFNLSNTPHFWMPDTSMSSPTFGQLTSTILSPREMQFALKLDF